jgi:hypothetical protein
VVNNNGSDVLLIVLAVMVGARIVWFGDFFRRCWRATAKTDHRTKVTLSKIRQTSTQLQGGGAARHEKMLALQARLFDQMLIVGAIGIAAWSQLFVSSNTLPASRLSGMTLGLLFAGAFCLVAGPLLWRAEGLHLTLMGRASALSLGFGLIALALTSVVLDLHLTAASMACIGVLLLIGLREVAEVTTWVRTVHPDLNY